MRRVDLNLLYVLRELLKDPNTTKVAEKLNLTQSAVSAALGRLRWAFQDDLFVRSGRAMAPTRRAIPHGREIRNGAHINEYQTAS